MLEGGTERIVIRVSGATEDVVVNISGAPSGLASLSASQVLLSAATDWEATVLVSSLDDWSVLGNSSYTLDLAADGIGSLSVGVSVIENDKAAASSGRQHGSYTKGITSQNNTVSAISKDDGKVATLYEGVFSDGTTGIEYRWQFTKLTAGTKQVQIDAYSAAEAFRFEYSVDNAATWRSFGDGPGNSRTWNGDFTATGVGTNLWVRLVDAVRSGDTVRDSFSIDVLTVGTPADSLL